MPFQFKNPLKRLCLALLLVSLAGGNRAMAASEVVTGSVRYEQVTPELYRGPQPTDVELNQLAAQGVKTIIDLRFGNRHSKEERMSAKSLGLNYIHIPLGYFIPSKKKIARILSVIRSPLTQPVFVHCRYGEDRTSMVVAIYQISDRGMSRQDAAQDMEKHNFKSWLIPMSRTVAHFKSSNAPVAD